MKLKEKAVLTPWEIMDISVLDNDTNSFAFAYLNSIFGISMDEKHVYGRQNLGEGYILPEEELIGRYSFAHGLWRAIEMRRNSFITRDRLWLDKQIQENGIAIVGDNEQSTEARVNRDMIHFLVDVAFRLGATTELVPVNLEALVRGVPQYES